MQRREWGIVGGLGAAILLIGYAFLQPQPVALSEAPPPVVRPPAAPPNPDRVALVEKLDRGQAKPHNHEAHDPVARRAPDPQPGGIEREEIARRPPLNDAKAWQDKRMAAAREMHAHQVATTQAFAEQQGYDNDQTAEIVDAIDTLHDRLNTLKAQVEQGALEPADLRAESPELRAEAAARIRQAIGQRDTEVLNARLASKLGGGF